MPGSKSHQEYYKGFQLVAAFYRGKYQGRAWHRITNKKFGADGPAVHPIIDKLKLTVDADVAENMAFYRQRLIDKHREVLASIAKPDLGQGVVSRYHRADSCYSCKEPVDNTFDLECKGCGWIICSYCGSCGCGYGHNPSVGALPA